MQDFGAFVAGVRAVVWKMKTDLCKRPCLSLSLPFLHKCKLRTIGVRFIVKFARRGSGGWTK